MTEQEFIEEIKKIRNYSNKRQTSKIRKILSAINRME